MLVDAKTGEIFIYDAIGQDWFGDGITGETVIQALDQLGGKRAKVRINSPGGNVSDGIAIYNALTRYPGGVDTVVDSLAASIASVIALAGESRTTAKGGRWMIHRAMTWAAGNSNDMNKIAEVLAVHDRAIIEIYKGYMAEKSEDEIEALMDAETWFTSEDAISAGLSTGMDGQVATKPNVANWFKNAPAAIYQTKGQSAIAATAARIRSNRVARYVG